MPSTAPGLERVAILPLRNSVLFPMSVVPINVGRPRSVRLVEELMGKDRALVGVLTQRQPETLEPTFEDLFTVGTLARVVKVIRLAPSNYSVVLNGLSRFVVDEPAGLEPFATAHVRRVQEPKTKDPKLRAAAKALRESTREVLSMLPDLPKETSGILDNVREPGALADLIASNLPDDHATIADRQSILEAYDVAERVRRVAELVSRQLEVLRVKEDISTKVQEEMITSQRDYVLRQQIRSIREELGEAAEDDEIEQLRERMARAELPPEAERIARKQLSRLGEMQPQSAEYNVTRNYVEWLADLPWSRATPDHVDVRHVRKCLDEDHYGLDRVKRRIVEYSAVRQLRADKKGPILLFVGPPGVGKTSLGRSIARAMGRRYGRISLGGVRDEAEIRGHRRTYVGALPGKVIQAMKKVGTKNPVLVLDEVDKMGVDMRGDPAAALLEVLDPEQNAEFVDHYIDVPFDLSQVTFLATANYWHGIPPALKDRMEAIEVPGYTRTEKWHIADQFLVPKQLDEHGLRSSQLEFPRDGVETIVDFYTREAGVRNLEREIAAVCREGAVRLAEGKEVENEVVTRDHVERVLGAHRNRPEVAERKLAPGVATGLGDSDAGGELLFVEATTMPGKGEVRLTGSLREVMKESAATAVSFVRSRAERMHMDPRWLEKVDLHLHVPGGGRTRDTTGMGITMFVAVASLLLEATTKTDVAMSGEITLRGNVLPVSGIKNKVLAAHRAGMKSIVLPERNRRDVDEIPEEIQIEMEFLYVTRVDEVLELVLEPPGKSKVSDRPPPTPGGEARP